ncbi:hypothetical protein T492DRAFT_845566 [Pavlovales sp. CCMP2436]|nr:hypothetical protein T492DRAFT_845566 [Pavlovales sp. CCMP2436]
MSDDLEFCEVVNLTNIQNKDNAARAFYKHNDGCALKLKYLEQAIGRGCHDASWINQVALTGTGHTHFLTKDDCEQTNKKEFVSISDVLFMEGLSEKLGKTLMRLLRRLKVVTDLYLYLYQELHVRGAVLTLIIGDPLLTGDPQLVGILGHTTFPHQALDADDPATINMTFTLEPGVKPGEAYQHLQGNCALTLARSPVAHDQVVGSARQLGTNGPEFGDDYKGALRLQHGWRLVNGHDVKCIVNSQSVQVARWQHEIFSQTMGHYEDSEVVVWAYLDGHMELDFDVHTGDPLPPVRLVNTEGNERELNKRCHIGTLIGDDVGGSIAVYYYTPGKYTYVHRGRAHVDAVVLLCRIHDERFNDHLTVETDQVIPAAAYVCVFAVTNLLGRARRRRKPRHCAIDGCHLGGIHALCDELIGFHLSLGVAHCFGDVVEEKVIVARYAARQCKERAIVAASRHRERMPEPFLSLLKNQSLS